MYTAHHDAKLLPLTFESPSYIYNEESLPAISASASKDKNGLVHISLVNIDSKNENIIVIDIAKLGVKNFSGSILTASTLQDHNTFDNPNKIKPTVFKAFQYKKGKLEITLPPFSVVMMAGE